ncbi:hypothetical protein [Actinokineospora spheciospongiae]|uniref:hypothetical protein n=1 Tax=Actinokineospora spheciospongiae TaxID=909613 RepID=UPI000D712195|nr:hypothetical protein [Actinokineospora spheciospongiae]PWW67088.1 hypothetical protein DFQ13_101606 [Actinokineospora spheciospongiae]
MLGHVELAASTAMYGVGIVAQRAAARRAVDSAPAVGSAGVGLFARLVRDRLYLVGFAAQVGGFLLAFLARASLPLYLVQAGASCAVGLAVVVGFLALGWRVRVVEVVVLLVMAFGLVLLAASAAPSPARPLPPGADLFLLAAVAAIAVLAVLACRSAAVTSLVVLAGAAFAVVAVSGRSLAAGPLAQLPLRPLAWVMVAAALVGQACLSVGLSRSSSTAAVAPMDAVTVVLTSAVGLAVLGDRVVPGRQWWVVAGLLSVLLGVVVLGLVSRAVAPAVVPSEAV